MFRSTLPHRRTLLIIRLKAGDLIPIEERSREEVAKPFGALTAPDKANVMNPAFDVTPADLVSAIITESGVIEKPNAAKLKAHFASKEIPKNS